MASTSATRARSARRRARHDASRCASHEGRDRAPSPATLHTAPRRRARRARRSVLTSAASSATAQGRPASASAREQARPPSGRFLARRRRGRRALHRRPPGVVAARGRRSRRARAPRPAIALHQRRFSSASSVRRHVEAIARARRVAPSSLVRRRTGRAARCRSDDKLHGDGPIPAPRGRKRGEMIALRRSAARGDPLGARAPARTRGCAMASARCHLLPERRTRVRARNDCSRDPALLARASAQRARGAPPPTLARRARDEDLRPPVDEPLIEVREGSRARAAAPRRQRGPASVEEVDASKLRNPNFRVRVRSRRRPSKSRSFASRLARARAAEFFTAWPNRSPSCARATKATIASNAARGRLADLPRERDLRADAREIEREGGREALA